MTERRTEKMKQCVIYKNKNKNMKAEVPFWNTAGSSNTRWFVISQKENMAVRFSFIERMLVSLGGDEEVVE